MFDSGCSLVVASKRFIDDLNGSVLQNDKLELRTPPYLPGATSAYGQRQDSCGIVDLGATIYNAQTKGDTPSMNMQLSAYVFENLSADLILGTPIWYDWIHEIKWARSGSPASIRLSTGEGGYLDLELLPMGLSAGQPDMGLPAGRNAEKQEYLALTKDIIAPTQSPQGFAGP